MRVSGIKGGAPRASSLPQDMLYTFSGRCILSGGKGELLLHAWYKHRLRDEYKCYSLLKAALSVTLRGGACHVGRQTGGTISKMKPTCLIGSSKFGFCFKQGLSGQVSGQVSGAPP